MVEGKERPLGTLSSGWLRERHEVVCVENKKGTSDNAAFRWRGGGKQRRCLMP